MPVAIHLRRATPFGVGDMERALRRARIAFEPAEADEGALWARYPLHPDEVNSRLQDQKGQLWFRAAVDDDGAIALSVSHSNVHVARNVTDLLRRSARLAETLKASVLVDGREIGEDDVDALTDEASAFVTKMVEGHRAALAAIAAMPLGAIEVPSGRSGDLVDEYALFEAFPEDPVTLDELEAELPDELPAEFGTRVARTGDVLVVLHQGLPGAYVLQRDARRWQIRPMHGPSTWPTQARAVFAALSKLSILGRGTTSWQGVPMDADAWHGFQARTHGSALEFALYARARSDRGSSRPESGSA